jgi:tRNA-dihydrouridine synthase B
LVRIGSIEINGPAALAPMAGVADRAFRTLCRQYGAAYTVSEMVSCKGLQYGDRKSGQLLQLGEAEHPAAAQLFGCDPALMAAAVIDAKRAGADVIDINMGCPAPKIVSSGGGSALMRSPALAGRIIEAVVKAAGETPVTVKLRKGWDEEHINVCELAKIAESCGAAAITVHGRTREQMYAGQADLAAIRSAVECVRIPVIGNGDVVDGPSAGRMLRETGCSMVMVGRGALGRPWVFSQIAAYLSDETLLPDPSFSERMQALCAQAQMAISEKGERIAMREMRKHAAWYFTGVRGAAALRREAGTLSCLADLYRLCQKAEAMYEESSPKASL